MAKQEKADKQIEIDRLNEIIQKKNVIITELQDQLENIRPQYEKELAELRLSRDLSRRLTETYRQMITAFMEEFDA